MSTVTAPVRHTQADRTALPESLMLRVSIKATLRDHLAPRAGAPSRRRPEKRE